VRIRKSQKRQVKTKRRRKSSTESSWTADAHASSYGEHGERSGRKNESVAHLWSGKKEIRGRD